MPFVNVHPFHLGPLEIHLFGILVATGVVTGASLAARYAEKYFIDVDWLRWFGFRLVVGGFIICHIIDVLFYQQDTLKRNPLILLEIWRGISSYGGFIGGFIMFMWYTQSRFKPPASRLELGDNAIIGFSVGFWFGRMGCSVAHDHPGIPTDFPLAVKWPAGRYPAYAVYHLNPTKIVQAHDLGLYESLFLMPAIVLGVFLLSKLKNRKPGLLVGFAATAYAIPRFFFEFLRIEATDPRYFGLTPGQWFSMMTLAAGLYILFWKMPKEKETTLALASARGEAEQAARDKESAASKAKKKSASQKASQKGGKKGSSAGKKKKRK